MSLGPQLSELLRDRGETRVSETGRGAEKSETKQKAEDMTEGERSQGSGGGGRDREPEASVCGRVCVCWVGG